MEHDRGRGSGGAVESPVSTEGPAFVTSLIGCTSFPVGFLNGLGSWVFPTKRPQKCSELEDKLQRALRRMGSVFGYSRCSCRPLKQPS